MGWPVSVLHFIVRSGAVVLVAHGKRNGRAEGEPIQHPGKNFHGIGLVAGGDNITLAGAAAIQLCLNHFAGKGHAGRATIDDNTHAHPVRLTPGADFENGTE